jgi:hypothetical protein
VARLLLVFAFLFAVALAPAATAATTRVRWTKVEVRAGDDAARVAKKLEKLLVQASRKAKWGKGDRLELTARVTTLTWEEREDILRVTVTVVARITGGKIDGGTSARSHIRLGGRPKDRRQIEEEALEIVSGGLVTRLSDIARRESGSERGSSP